MHKNKTGSGFELIDAVPSSSLHECKMKTGRGLNCFILFLPVL